MKRRRHTPEQIVRKLAEGEKLLSEGKTIDEVSRHLEITESTWHRWRNQYGGMKADDAKSCAAAQGEPAPEEDRGRPGPRHRHAQGAEPGKLLTPDSRRRAVVALREQFGVTERRACRVVGQPRSTQRLPPPVPSDDELALRAFLRDFARRRPRWGWRRSARAARDAGWRVNDKRIHRLWIAEGLRVPYRKRKKPLRGIGVAMGAFCPIRPNVVWALDFQFDQSSDGRTLKFLNVLDEFHPRGPRHRHRTLHRRRGCGPMSRALGDRARGAGLRPLRPRPRVHRPRPRVHRPRGGRLVPLQRHRHRHRHRVHRPGVPVAERLDRELNGRMRDEHLKGQQFDSLLEAQVLTEVWRVDYNMNRPHSAHGWLTPLEFVEDWLHRQEHQLA